MERESFKEYSEATMVEKEELYVLYDEIMLRGASYVFINVGHITSEVRTNGV